MGNIDIDIQGLLAGGWSKKLSEQLNSIMFFFMENSDLNIFET